LVPWLTHLPAPVGACALRLDRFSPNFEDAERLGFTGVRPLDPYGYIFSGLPGGAIANLAYYFSFDYADRRNVARYTRTLDRRVTEWIRTAARSELVSIRRRDRLIVCDLRSAARSKVTVL